MTDSQTRSGSTPGEERERSAFQRALSQYLLSLPEKSKMGTLIEACTSGDDALTAESINEYIKRAEGRKSLRRKIEKFLSPVVKVLKDYDGVINSLISADPMPTALIWGALKVVIDGAYRFTELFETIRSQLGSLTFLLKRINEYEHLYGESERMQDLLCDSYIDIFRFWNQVNKECDRCRPSVFFRTTKLNKIISDLQSDADHIWQQGLLIEASIRSDERKHRRVEENNIIQDRTESQKERRSFQAWRTEQQNERDKDHYRQIHSWIGFQEWNEANNSTRHRENKKIRQDETCDWLARQSAYSVWQSGNTDPSIIWLHSPPGFGKTILCSHAIQLIKDSDPAVAVVYHFYREERHTGCETLRILAGQLFECYGQLSTQVDEELYLRTQRRTCSLENIQELITILVTCFPKTYFFIDGLDQEDSPERWKDALTVLEFLIELSRGSPETVRVWYSSQSRPLIKEKLEDFITFDIRGELEVRSDVMRYLSRAMSRAYPELDELEGEKDKLLEKMEGRAEGNFLVASLMLKALQEDTDSLTEMREFIEHDELPTTLDGYYRRIFERIAPPRRRLASTVFSLIAFARRPLRMQELREAVGLLQSKTPESPKAADMPFIPRLRELFDPMIEIPKGSFEDDMDDSTCRFFHATVRDFLVKNPEVLGNNLPITPRIIADACLGYLCQARYAQLLKESDVDWVDIRGQTVDRHHFLLYAAKYWDKHLNHVTESEELHKRVLSFVTSSNFQTCIQVQSLWVEHKFAVFSVWDNNYAYLHRVFPSWFTRNEMGLRKAYRRFEHDWRHLLDRGNGEVDRCWWAGLGPQNFLSTLQGRYTSFLFQADEDANHESCPCFDGISSMGDQLKKLQLRVEDQDTLEFICEHWSLSTSDRAPTLERRQTIFAQTDATNWLMYSQYSGDISTPRVGQPAPAMFSFDCQFLRIGAQLFALNDQGLYVSMPGLNRQNEVYPAYIEEFTSSQHYVVLATRRTISKSTDQCASRNGRVDGFGENIQEGQSNTNPTSELTDDEDKAVDSEFDSSHSSLTDSTDRAYETWSECSTEYEDEFEDDIIAPWTGPVDLEESDFSDSSQSSSKRSSDADQSAEPGSDSGPDDPLPTSAIVGYGQWHSDDEDYDMEGEATYYAQIALATRPWTQRSRSLPVSLIVFDISRPGPKRIFYFSSMVSSMLYASPPVIHPSKALVVWPLGGGEVLFADFVANTYFVRKLRPSTPHTRHIFMKCRFSPCGRYLHIASLEVQRKPDTSSRRNAKQFPLKISLLVSTYRLCCHKTTKSPPTLVHRAKVHIGFGKSLSVSKLPYTLTWSPRELYFTCSDDILRVYRIHLFNASAIMDKTWGEHSVLMPRETMFLPGSASQREVYYFPPPEESTLARIVVGSEARAHHIDVDDKLLGGREGKIPLRVSNVVGLEGSLSPPIGCYLDENEDLGGWVKSQYRANIPEALGIGRLDRRREKFDFDDDCDLEQYII